MTIKSISILVNIILLILIFISVRKCNVNEDSVDLLEASNDISFQQAKYYQNKNGDLIGQVKTHELTIRQWKANAEDLGFERDKLKMENRKLKNLTAHWQGQASAKDTIEIVLQDTIYIDNGTTVVNRKFDWSNQYLALNGVIHLDTMTVDYSYNMDFSLTVYRKPRKGFWNPPGQLVADIYFTDPQLQVASFKGFVVKGDRKRWFETNGFKIGLGAVAGFAGYRYLVK